MCCGGVPVRGVWECACESAVHPPAVNTTSVDKISAFFKKEIVFLGNRDGLFHICVEYSSQK